MKDHFNYVPSANSDTMIKIDYNLFYQLSIFDYYRLRMPGLNATLTSAKKLVRQSHIVQSVMQGCQGVLTHLLPVCNLLV